MQPLGVHPHVDADDLVVAGAGLGVDLAGEEGRPIRRDVPAVLQKEPLQVVHLLAHALAGAQGLSGRAEGRSPSTAAGRRGLILRPSSCHESILCIRAESCWSSGTLCFSPWISARWISGFPR